MPKSARNRQLAKQHARRQAERRQRQRRRQTTTIAIALVVALVGSLAVFLAFTGGDEPPPAASAPTGPTASSGPTGSDEPGAQTGTVQPEPGPEQVACGAAQPRTALRPKPQFSSPAEVVERGDIPVVEIQTSCGTVVVRLLADRAPETVNSFVFLAQQKYFDGQRFHRLDTSLDVVQGGDPTGRGDGGPGYSIPDELTGDEIYEAGLLAMANAGPDTGGSQFFFVTGPGASGLPPSYTIFGRVIEGMDVLELIQGLPVQDPEAAAAGDIGAQAPAEAVYIEKVTIAQE